MIDVASRSDDELLALVTPGVANGWGASGTVTVDGERLFLKRLPLTDVEVTNPRSTRNRFRLPPYYSYGVGSAGFGAWRELAALELVAGMPAFPSLLHWRVLPSTTTPRQLPQLGDAEGYVAYWNGNRAIGEYMAARASATSELWLFLEHAGDMAFAWLLSNQARADEFVRDAHEAAAQAGDAGMVHFDAHLGNVVVADGRVRLADFGLAMAETFDLRADERRFLDRHRRYDEGTVLGSLGQMLLAALGSQTASDFDRALAERPVPYDDALWAVYERYRAPIRYMLEHFERMMRPSKRSRYDDAELGALLKSAGVASG